MSDAARADEFSALLAGVADRGLSDDQRQRLADLMAADRDLRRQYLEYCQMHAMLRYEHGVVVATQPNEIGVEMRRRTLLSKNRLAWFSAAAAVLLVVAAIIRPQRSQAPATPERGRPVATLKTAVGVQFDYGAHGETTSAAGTPMPQGQYQLSRGIVELEYSSGALLTVEAPAEFRLVDESIFRLDSGRVAAHVPEEAHGFKVDTAAATVVDLGTDFAVEASPNEPSEVHVFEGEVRVELRHGKGVAADPLRLLTGQATKIDGATGLPAGIDLDDQRFLRRLDAEPQVYARSVLAMGPSVYYRMEPTGDGATLHDSAGDADATVHPGEAARPVWAPGKVGTAFVLGGPAQQTYASAATYPRAPGKQLSVVAWVYARSRPRWASIAKNWAGADDHGQFHFGLHEDSGVLESHIADRKGREIVVKDSTPLPLNQWHHVAFVADGTMLRLYREGREIDAAPYDDLVGDPRIRALAIGTKLNLAGVAPEEREFNMWDGRLDELAIFNKALSPEDVRRLYEVGSRESGSSSARQGETAAASVQHGAAKLGKTTPGNTKLARD